MNVKKLTGSLFAVVLLCAAFATPANAAFGIGDPEVSFTDENGAVAMGAGSHPFAMRTSFTINTKGEEPNKFIEEAVRDLFVEQAGGFAGNPTAVPRCGTADFLNFVGGMAGCADSSAVGKLTVVLGGGGMGGQIPSVPVFNLEPPPGVAAKLGFWVAEVPVTVDVGVQPTPPYNVVASLRNTSQVVELFANEFELWGVPADPAHDSERGKCLFKGGKCPADIPVKPFITLPRSCTGPLVTTFTATSWLGSTFSTSTATDDGGTPPQPLGTTGCGKLDFGPDLSVRPSTESASSPSGLAVSLEIDDEGLNSPTGSATQSDMRRAVVSLPEQMTLNPSVAAGLETCSPSDLARETLHSSPGEGCPQASKVGAVEVETPILEDKVIKGSLFVATQDDPATTQPGAENPFDSLIALYLVIRDPELGIIVKQPGKVEADPESGQVTTVFGAPGHELPQFPLSDVRIRLREGARSPLISPPTCGTHTTKAIFTPWSNPSTQLERSASFQITSGVNGGPCPSGPPPFEPGFEGGSLNNQGGAFSPFHMRLTRRDGDQDLARFDATLPRGMIAKLAGTTQCGEAEIAMARARTSGREELASPSCPASSRLGSVYGGAGVGSQLTYVPGSFYLAGPVNGAPLSVVAIVPAVAGPFDVGNVVVRQALRIDPKTAEVKVDSAASDALPTMLAGIPLKVRDVRVEVDRPSFTLNPTSCDPSTMSAGLWAIGAGSPVIRDQRFQAAGCSSLGFKPKLALNLKGGTKRGSFPALTTVLTPRSGDANLEGLSLRLPRSAFLEQGHFRTICTRVQFAAGAGNGEQCPAGSIYGKVTAFTPILDEPAEGNVYLRSSSHDLPDIVLALQGPPSAAAKVEVTARVDSHKGGIRVTVADVPDLPVSKAIVTMQGGQKGLIVNSRDLCAKPSKASAEFSAQNGKSVSSRPLVRATGCKGKKRTSKRKSRGADKR